MFIYLPAMGQINFCVIIPDRGDRPDFLANCMRMIKAQTIQPDIIEIVSDPPENDQPDITKRYRIGYERLRNKGLDCIFLVENDDWYAPFYFEYMVLNWVKSGAPSIFGTGYTIYYHLKLKAWHKMGHDERASAMNTLIKPDLDFEWCKDEDPYTDQHLWKILKGVTIFPEILISIGMKHGIGKCGGAFHTDRFKRYINADPDMLWLKRKIDLESFNFYSQIKF